MNVRRVPASHSHSTPPVVEEIPSLPVAIFKQRLFTLDFIDSNNFPAGTTVPITRVASVDVPTLRECSKEPDDAAIIDVDAFEYKDILKQ
jgi:hypothetical protein